jgi:hypothetical protein
MSKRIAAFTILALSFTFSAPLHASDHPYEKLLVPIIVHSPVGGAFGSRFVTRLIVHNDSAQAVRVDQVGGHMCLIPGCLAWVAPGTHQPNVWASGLVGGRGAFIWVDSSQMHHLTFQLRVQDLSRQESTWGTELPILRESDFFDDRLTLIDVPDTENFRQTLRIYEWEGTPRNPVVMVRFYDQESGALLRELPVVLERFSSSAADASQAQVGFWTDDFADLRPAERLRIVIEPVTPGIRFWAFVSITHNETQHITTITPLKLRP